MHPTSKTTSILICLIGLIKIKLQLLLIHHSIFGPAAHLKLPDSTKQAKSMTTSVPSLFVIRIKLPSEIAMDKLKFSILPNVKRLAIFKDITEELEV